MNQVLLSVEVSQFTMAVLAVVMPSVFLLIYTFLKRYIRASTSQVLVRYGLHKKTHRVEFFHGRSAFVWPLIQGHDFLDLTPITIKLDIAFADREESEKTFEFAAIAAISPKEPHVSNAAQRLLGVSRSKVHELVKDIAKGVITASVSKLRNESSAVGLSEFKSDIDSELATELNKIGIELIEVNLTDNSIFK